MKKLIILIFIVGCSSGSKEKSTVTDEDKIKLWTATLLNEISNFETGFFCVVDEVGLDNKTFINSSFAENHNIVYTKLSDNTTKWSEIIQNNEIETCDVDFDSIRLIEKVVFDTFPDGDQFVFRRKRCGDFIKYIEISKPFYLDNKFGVQLQVVTIGPPECSDLYILVLDTTNLKTEKVYFLEPLN